MNHIRFAYFGGEPLGVPVLEELKACGLLPKLIVCNPDRPQGRKLILTPPPVKIWAQENNIETFQPESLKDSADLVQLTGLTWDLFVVVAYNKILPEWLLELPTHKTINVHPSLLPLYRGASPIRTAILEDNRDAIGVSVMLMDKAMDHGPILAQQSLPISDEHWPIRGLELDTALSHMGGAMLASVIPNWIEGKIIPIEQDHSTATYCHKLTKDMGELQIDPLNLPTGKTAYQTLLTIKALEDTPGTFFIHNEKRVKVTDATVTNGQLQITSVIPEGKKQMSFAQYIESV